MSSIDAISGSSSSLSSLLGTSSSDKTSTKTSITAADFAAANDAVVLDASLGTNISGTNPGSASNAAPDFYELYKSLSLTAKQIVDKINEQLKTSLPDGVQSLKPEDVTPDATADRIVTGVTAFFDTYAKQHKDLSGDDLINSFLSEVQKGVNQGYGDAFNTLKGIGALDVDGVQDGIEKTRSLIDEKLAAWETQKRTDLGLPAKVAASPDAQLQGTPTVDAVA